MSAAPESRASESGDRPLSVPRLAAQRRLATRLEVRRATLRVANMWLLLFFGGGRSGGLGGGFEAVCLVRLLLGEQPDRHEVEWADEAVADSVPTGASDRVAQRHRPVMLEQDQRRRGVVGDLLDDVPGLLVRERADAVRGRFSARFGARVQA